MELHQSLGKNVRFLVASVPIYNLDQRLFGSHIVQIDCAWCSISSSTVVLHLQAGSPCGSLLYSGAGISGRLF